MNPANWFPTKTNWKFSFSRPHPGPAARWASLSEQWSDLIHLKKFQTLGPQKTLICSVHGREKPDVEETMELVMEEKLHLLLWSWQQRTVARWPTCLTQSALGFRCNVWNPGVMSESLPSVVQLSEARMQICCFGFIGKQEVLLVCIMQISFSGPASLSPPGWSKARENDL